MRYFHEHEYQTRGFVLAPWPKPGCNTHLHFVLSDPNLDRQRVLVAPLMSWVDGCDTSCVLESGDHPFVRHSSYVNYSCAVAVSADELERGIAAKEFALHHPASVDVLDRMRKGASLSKDLKLKLLYILEDQKLVLPD